MPAIMDRLIQDHANLAKLLDALERQIALFDHSEQLDFDIIEGVVGYCLTYPDLYHHPTEDLVLERLRLRAPEVADKIGELDTRHRELSELTRRFAAAVHNLVRGADMSRDAVDGLAREFLETYRTHMEMEDRYFFPAAERYLGKADWTELAKQAKRTDDPLFDSRGESRFRRLREDLLTWDRDAAGA